MNPSPEQTDERPRHRRLFVGLRFPDAAQTYLRERAADWQTSRALHGGRFAHDFHVTLRFLGDVAEQRIDHVAKALEVAYASVRAFPVTAGPLGAFPGPARVSVLWCGMDQGRAELVECAKRTEVGLVPIGFDRERRPFAPHITLARFRQTPDLRCWLGSENDRIRSGDATPFPPFTAIELALIESELSPDGALYTSLVSYPLK